MPAHGAPTLTFLLSDLAESAALWERYPQAFSPLLDRYTALIRRHVAEHQGLWAASGVDLLTAAFTAPHAALAAALAIIRQAREEAWLPLADLPIRIALYTGVAEQRDNTFVGLPLQRGQRLLRAAAARQILTSRLTAELLSDQLPAGVDLVPQGRAALRAGGSAEPIFHVVAPDLLPATPPQRHGAGPPAGFPAPATRLIGRHREIAQISELFREGAARLVTITGTGGTGKTRLAIEAARALADHFADGVWFVDLSALHDSLLVVPTIARLLDVKPVGALADFLRQKELLLVLDNVEQVAASGAQLLDLLTGAAQLALLITSRIPLRIYGEYELPLAPLGLPHADPSQGPPIQSEAVQLLVSRLQAQGIALCLDGAEQAVLATIATALDGLPLAIELAAARGRVLPPRAIAARLDDRFLLLADQTTGRPSRHQTLRATLDWSYELLAPAERSLFVRLGIFVGGCTLEAAAAVGGEPAAAIGAMLDVLDRLIAVGLLRRDPHADGQARYVMLETVRAYAVERLANDPQAAQVAARHAQHFLQLAESLAPQIVAADQLAALATLEREHPNLRVAIEHALTHRWGELAVRLGVAMRGFWIIRGHAPEGYRWLALALDQAGDLPAALRAGGLIGAGLLAHSHDRHDRAEAHFQEALELGRAYADPAVEVWALNGLASVERVRGNYPAVRALSESALAIARRLADAQALQTALINLGIAGIRTSQLDEALVFLSEGAALARRGGDHYTLVQVLGNLAMIGTYRREYAQAHQSYSECLTLCRDLGDRPGEIRALISMGALAAFTEEYVAAQRYFMESLALCRRLGDRRNLAMALLNLSNVADKQGDHLAGRDYAQEALQIGRALENRQVEVTALFNLASALAGLGEQVVAVSYYQEALRIYADIGDLRGVCITAEALALGLARHNRAERALLLLAGAAALRDQRGVPYADYELSAIRPQLGAIRERLGEPASTTIWAAGQALALEGLVQACLAPALVEELRRRLDPPDASRMAASAGPEELPDGPQVKLTEREAQVLHLVAEGQTDKAIALALRCGSRTVNTHVRTILDKLQVTSRAAAVRRAIELGLL